MKGRKELPAKIKQLRGTEQKCRVKTEIDVQKVFSIDAKKLKVLKTKRSRDIFTEKANQLIALGILTENDFEQLAIYANSLDIVFECMEKTKSDKFEKIETSTGHYYIPNPYLKLYRDMVEIVNKIGSEFGFSPVSRTKLAHKPVEIDPLAELLKQFDGK